MKSRTAIKVCLFLPALNASVWWPRTAIRNFLDNSRKFNFCNRLILKLLHFFSIEKILKMYFLFGYATSVEKNTQCSLWLDISDKAGIKLRFAFQVFCSVGASWISRRRRNFPNVDKFSAHHFKNMHISSEGYEIVMQFA